MTDTFDRLDVFFFWRFFSPRWDATEADTVLMSSRDCLNSFACFFGGVRGHLLDRKWLV